MILSYRNLHCHRPPHTTRLHGSTSLLHNKPITPIAGARASSVAHSSVSNSLISVLKDELKYERESYRKDEALLEDPPNEFELYDPPGKNCFFLHKKYKNEGITIEVDIDAQPKTEADDENEDGSDDYDEVVPVHFEVQVMKRECSLIFECESNGDFLVINHIALQTGEDEDEEDSDTPYSGPVFDDLDDTLQQAFLDYLEERGVNADLGEYIRLLALDKMSVEYQTWLQRVRDFIAQ